MTKKENREFFNKVKGKKIRWSGWTSSTYFIVDDLGGLEEDVLEGTIYLNNIPNENNAFICEGFEDSAIGNHWEYFEKQGLEINRNDLSSISTSRKPVCTCNINDLMNYGCRCGCIQKERSK